MERARRAAAEARAAGEYEEGEVSFEAQEAGRIEDWRITEWVMIEPDQARVYSTRRWGAPVTWLKRLLLRLLRQYNDQVLAQQSRFNAHVAAHVMSLDERVSSLERGVADAERRARDPR
jgi:hypothetical protein